MDGKEDRIRQLAHKFWLDEGKPEGRATEHWDRARRHIEANGAASLDGKQARDDILTPSNNIPAPDNTPAPNSALAPQKASLAKRMTKSPSARPKTKKSPQTSARRPLSESPKDTK